MQIGAVSMRPYVYNTNVVGRNSMNKISAISDDVTSSRLDASALVSEEAKKQETTNPLKRGQSLDFAGIIQMQMQMSRMNAARIMQPAEKEQEDLAPFKAEPAVDMTVNAANMNAGGIAGSTIDLMG